MADRIARLLGLWQDALLETRELSAWVDAQLRAFDPLPDLLLALAMDGPERLLHRMGTDFELAIEAPPFALRLGLRALDLQADDEAACKTFLGQALREVWLEESFDSEEAGLCVRLDHLLNDCGDWPATLALLRQSLPALRNAARARALDWLAPLGGLRTREPDGRLVYTD